MKRNLGLIAITFIPVAAGCAGSPLGDGNGPTTGLYQLTESRSGSCQPTLADDKIEAYVIADRADAPTLYMSGPWFGPPAIGMRWAAVVMFGGSVTQNENDCSSTLHTEIVIDEVSADHVHAHRIDSFSGVAAARGVPDPCMPAALPAGDCTQRTELDYVLTQPCPKQCIQSGEPVDPVSLEPSMRCSC